MVRLTARPLGTNVAGGAASFAAPIGYQTNLMVFGPGGYHFGDYVRFGLPINLAIGALTVIIIPYVRRF